MVLTTEQELDSLRRMTPNDLQERYTAVFGERPRSRNKAWLVKRTAWRLQALEEGELSERARHRAAELANDADLRMTAPRTAGTAVDHGLAAETPAIPLRADLRLPMPGAIITREYRGQKLEVKILAKGFEYQGLVYRSLTAVARAITGAHWNGYRFFGIQHKGIRR